MPDRSYYLDGAAAMVEIRAKYATHVASILELVGMPAAAARAARIIALEHEIATVHSSRAATEDVLKGNNHWPRSDFDSKAPGLNWRVFFAAAHLPQSQRDFVAWQPAAVTGIAALVASQPLATWKDYLIFHAVEHRAAFLPRAVVAEHFAFYGTTLNGTPELRVRWKRAIDATNDALGEAVGKLYVERYFPARAKASIEEMVERLRAAFARRIDNLDWMTQETKTGAKAKLAALKVGIGYPDHWRAYAGIKIAPDDAFGNAERAASFEYRHQLAKLGRPVDRAEWVMTPQLVNAVNLPAMNALNFPAGMLQPPFFNPDADAAHNYGAIGTIIGHEISHSFDDQGSTFDATGRLRNWWAPQDLEHFRAAGTRLVQQFDAYHPFPDLAVNGQQTLSENIADLGGACGRTRRVPAGGQRPLRQRRRRFHWRAPLLFELCAELARESPRSGAAQRGTDRWSRARRVSSQHGAKCRRLVCSFRHPGRPATVSCTGRPGARLVTAGPRP
jgi:predicted metalloendopeptidase